MIKRERFDHILEIYPDNKKVLETALDGTYIPLIYRGNLFYLFQERPLLAFLYFKMADHGEHQSGSEAAKYRELHLEGMKSL